MGNDTPVIQSVGGLCEKKKVMPDPQSFNICPHKFFHVLTKFYYFNTVNTYLTALLSSFLQNSNASINNLNKNFCKQCFALYKRNFTRNLVSEYIV